MALVIAGRIVPLDRADPAAVFKGRVYLDDSGTIDSVAPGNAAAPAGFVNAPLLDVGDAFVLPGLIDLHNHIGYNALPLWTEPSQQTAFLHHESWTRAATYQKAISWPAKALVEAAPEALLAYVQLRALVGGTTAIQGWPSANRQHVQVLRDIDDETAGKNDRNLIYTSALTKKPLELGRMAQAQKQGAGFIYHCAEGQVGSLVAREFVDVANAGCLEKTLIGIHCNAVSGPDWKRWAASKAGAIAWSPFSNLWLYGTTTDIAAARQQGVAICLGSDWGPSGSKNVQGELKVAKLASQKLGLGLSDQELVAMLTTNPGDALSRCWKKTIGRDAGRLRRPDRLSPAAGGKACGRRSSSRGSARSCSWSSTACRATATRGSCRSPGLAPSSPLKVPASSGASPIPDPAKPTDGVDVEEHHRPPRRGAQGSGRRAQARPGPPARLRRADGRPGRAAPTRARHADGRPRLRRRHLGSRRRDHDPAAAVAGARRGILQGHPRPGLPWRTARWPGGVLRMSSRKKSRKAPKTGVKSLPWGERLDILDALSAVLEGVYAHLTLKRSLYGFDILRALEHLRQQLPTMTDLQFHRELTSLMNRLRDAHTQYTGPWKTKDPVTSLPFLVEAYGPAEHTTYVVSKVDRRSVRDPHFVQGVTVQYWNGIPFDRAVDLHAENETGGRPDARRARALESLTFRALDYAPPPDEEWVVLQYTDLAGRRREVTLPWQGLDPQRSPAASQTLATRVRRAINPAAEAVRRAKKYRFSHGLWRAERAAGAGRKRGADPAKAFADFLTARTVKTRSGEYGYLRIWSFDVDDDQAFIAAAIALLRDLPDRGLILDLRDNPGGYIWAAERLLQLFTPNAVTPTRFSWRATSLTAAMARAPFNQDELAPWAESLFSAQLTGEPYSSHLPITPYERCNDLGQHYSGPVVAVVDANTYSSGDLFTAGILDNRIGPVVCIGEATGAGGANVWDSDDLRAALAAAEHPLPKLPAGVSFTLAVRRAVRSGDADGTLIEDAGIPGQPYEMTREDVLGRGRQSNRDLIEHCGELLAAQPWTRLDVTRRGRALTVSTVGLDQMDLYLDGHPGGPTTPIPGDGSRRVVVPAGARLAEVVGFASGAVRQRRRIRMA